MRVNTLWNEEFRPKTIADCIIPDRIASVLNGYIKNNDIPSLLFYGPAGCCKTTTAKAIVNELQAEYLFINGSDETGKADILNKTIPFATGVSLGNTKRVVIIDECDRLTMQAQDSLKSYMEQFSDNCRFIFTANTPSRIIKPIHSRCLCFDFNIQSQEKAELMVKLFKSITSILISKNIEFDNKALQAVVFRDFPDYRRIVNNIQAYATAHNCIDEGIVTFGEADIVTPLYTFIKAKDFDGVRKWLYEANYTQEEIFQALWTGINQLPQKIIPSVIVILADYQFKAERAIIPQVNILACLVEIMNEI